LIASLERAGIRLDDSGYDRIWTFHRYLREKNPEMNLTRIFNFESMVRKHYVDSLIILSILKQKRIDLPPVVMDLGTGPGFPGIPLAIALPHIRFLLTEGRKQRTEFLRTVANLCGLDNVEVVEKKIVPTDAIPAGAVITRAVSTMLDTAERTDSILKTRGLLIFMKGPNCDDEIAIMESLEGAPFSLLIDHSYTLPDSDDHRRLVVYRKNVESFQAPHRKPEIDLGFETQTITSTDNPRYKIWKSLNSGRMIRKHGLALVSGRKIILEYLQSDETASRIEALIVNERFGKGFGDDYGAQLGAMSEPPPITLLPAPMFSEIDPIGSGDLLLLYRFPEVREWDGSGPALLLPLSDPENLGAALRSAAAFGWSDVVLLKEAAHPYHARSIRAASGCQSRLNLLSGPSIQEIRCDHPLYALSVDGEEISTTDFPPIFSLLTGMEGTGLPDSLKGVRKISIPISPRVESLNAAVALGIALYEISVRGKPAKS
jgi:16S rRNA (guanine527-N7)-methyltransferase